MKAILAAPVSLLVLGLMTYLVTQTAAQTPQQQTPPAQPTPEHPQAPLPQTPPAGGRGGRAGQAAPTGGGFANAYPQREPGDPQSIARGKAIYGVNCTFCHGADARGGSGGPSLIRSQTVLNDKDGELITPIVQKGLPDRGMPSLPLSTADVKDVAAFIHSFRVAGYDSSRQRPPSILVGDAAAGAKFFQAKCASCHTVAAMTTFNARFSDPRTMQQGWLMPGGGGRGGAPTTGAPTMVTVTQANGAKITGRLVRIDDFVVTLTPEGAAPVTFARTGEMPKVEVKDPLQPHKDLLGLYTDKNIHDVTAYLVTLK